MIINRKKLLMEYKNIIFDVDGTLLDSYTPYMNALEKAVVE